MSTVSVVYHSGMGHTKMMAEAVAKGAADVEGVDVNFIPIEGKDIVDGRWKNDDVLEQLDASDGTQRFGETFSSPKGFI